MKNKRGQALVEFVIILPVFLLLVFAIIDFGRIIYTMNTLEGVNNDVETLYKAGKTEEEMLAFVKKTNKSASLNIINREDGLIQFDVLCEVKLVTPGLGLVIANPYEVKVSRVIYNE